MNKQLVSVDNGKLVTTSVLVAETFGKRHADVIRGIEILKGKCPSDFTERNFALSEYTDQTGRSLPMYNLTRDGMTLLVMGYTGEKAIQFKLAYIDAFNKMEEYIASQRCAALLAPKRELSLREKIEDLENSLRKFKHPGQRWLGMPNAERYRTAYDLYCAAIDSVIAIRRIVDASDRMTSR